MDGIVLMILGVALILLYTRAPQRWSWNKAFYGYNIGTEVGAFSFGLLLFFLGLAITLGKTALGDRAIFVAFHVLPLFLILAGLLVLVSQKATSLALRVLSAGPNPTLNRKWLSIWLVATGAIWFCAFLYLQS